jgi:hypothetical protein
MSDENSPPLAIPSGRRQREDALHLGPRKKAYVQTSIIIVHCFWSLVAAAWLIHLYPTDDTLVEPSMHYVMLKPYSPTAFCVRESWQTNQRSHSPQSMFYLMDLKFKSLIGCAFKAKTRAPRICSASSNDPRSWRTYHGRFRRRCCLDFRDGKSRLID